MIMQIKWDCKTVAVFQEESGGSGAEFSTYFRSSRVFAACMFFLRKKLIRELILCQISSLLFEKCVFRF